MANIYIVRELGFKYDDEVHYTDHPGGITGQFSTENEARAEINRLNLDRITMAPLGEYKGFGRASQEKIRELKAYLDPLLEDEIFEYNENYDMYYFKQRQHVPASMTDEQVIHMLDMMDVTFYELNVFEEQEAAYYIIWIPRLNHPLQAEIDYSYRGDPKEISPYFFASKQKALDSIGKLSYLMYRIPFEESVENLSDTPELLTSFIESKQSINVNDGKLKISYDATSEDLTGLNALLKEPLFEIRSITLEEARNYPLAPYHAV